MGRTLVDLTSDRIPLRVMNLSRQQMTIPKGAEVCRCDVISAILTPVEVGNPEKLIGHVQSVKTLEALPTHLRELYDHSTSGLSEDQRSEVHQLLCSFSDVFSAGPDDLRCTDLAKHHIDTGQAFDRQRHRRQIKLSKREM